MTAVFRRSRPPLPMPAFLGPLPASRRCGALAVSPMATNARSAAASSCYLSLRTSGSSCGTARSTSSPPPLVSGPPSRRGTTSSGFTSKLLAVNAEGTPSLLIRIPGVATNAFLHTLCDRRHTFALCPFFSVSQMHSAPETCLPVCLSRLFFVITK